MIYVMSDIHGNKRRFESFTRCHRKACNLKGYRLFLCLLTLTLTLTRFFYEVRP